MPGRMDIGIRSRVFLRLERCFPLRTLGEVSGCPGGHSRVRGDEGEAW
jgi:hypothetical protein